MAWRTSFLFTLLLAFTVPAAFAQPAEPRTEPLNDDTATRLLEHARQAIEVSDWQIAYSMAELLIEEYGQTEEARLISSEIPELRRRAKLALSERKWLYLPQLGDFWALLDAEGHPNTTLLSLRFPPPGEPRSLQVRLRTFPDHVDCPAHGFGSCTVEVWFDGKVSHFQAYLTENPDDMADPFSRESAETLVDLIDGERFLARLLTAQTIRVELPGKIGPFAREFDVAGFSMTAIRLGRGQLHENSGFGG